MTPLPRSSRPARVVIYVRCSTEEQATEGVTLQAQLSRCRAAAVAQELEVVGVFKDAGISAKNLDRPALQKALQALDDGNADALLVAKLDRLTRRVRDLGELLDTYFTSRFALLSVADSIDTRTAGGRLVLHVLTSVAEWEREAISERTSAALQHLKAQGVVLGRKPLELERKDGAATKSRAQALASKGMSMRDVAKQLTAEGRATSRGGRWSHRQVALLLAR